MSRGVKVTVALVIVAGLVLGAGHWLHRGRSGKPAADAPIPVTVVPVVQEDVPIYRVGKGTVTALNTVAVQPQIASQGPLLSLHFREGDAVSKGQLLALIDPRPYQAKLDADLGIERSDEASLATNQSTYQRNKGLLARGYISTLQMETYANNVKQSVAKVASDEGQLQADRVQLSYTRIYSPIDGIAGIRNIDPGNQVSTSTTLVTITQITPIYVKFPLPESDLDAVRAAAASGTAPAVAALDSADNHRLASDGYLDVIDNQIDVDSGTFQLRAVFPNRRRELWPGQFVNARLQLRTVHGGRVIPAQAVQRGPDGDYVYRVKPDQTVVMQPVHVAAEVDDSHVLIDEGLSVGMSVVTEGQFRLKPGSKIEALKPGQVPAAPAAAEPQRTGQRRQRGG